MIVLRKINAREDIQKFKSEFEEKIKKLYSSENLTELPELGESISQTLEKFAPGSQLKLKWDEVKPPDIPLPAAKATLVEDNFEGEITHKGHGLQRALIVTLLQHLAVTIPMDSKRGELDESDGNIIENKDNLNKTRGPDLILAIEEPELYLHPSRCRYLSNLLLQLAERPEIGLAPKNQIIYTTHSPYFVDLHRFDQIRLVRKVFLSDSSIPQSVVKHFPLDKAKIEIARICNVPPNDFTRESFKARAMSVMNTIVNEGFFADVVVIVEGQSEVGMLWKLQEIMEKDWAQRGIIVIPAGGKNNIDRPVVIFRGFSIPTYFIFDADAHLRGDGNKEEVAKNRNHRYLRLAGFQIEDFPRTQVHETWAVFEKNLELLLKETLGNETYFSIRRDIAIKLGFDRPERVIKNIEGAAHFIDEVYTRGNRIPILEEVVEKVTQLSDR